VKSRVPISEHGGWEVGQDSRGLFCSSRTGSTSDKTRATSSKIRLSSVFVACSCDFGALGFGRLWLCLIVLLLCLLRVEVCCLSFVCYIQWAGLLLYCTLIVHSFTTSCLRDANLQRNIKVYISPIRKKWPLLGLIDLKPLGGKQGKAKSKGQLNQSRRGARRDDLFPLLSTSYPLSDAMVP
jgi:hypothetical protein